MSVTYQEYIQYPVEYTYNAKFSLEGGTLAVLVLHWGSKYQTSPVIKWSKHAQLPDGSDIKWYS